MKFFLSLAVCFLILSSCDKDDDKVDTNLSVKIETLTNSLIPNGGVILRGKIENLEGVFDYGFVISTIKEGTYNNIGRKETFKGGINGEFSVELLNGLIEGQKYYYNVIVYKIDGNLYGKEKLFVSNGSAQPTITEIIPNKACLNDTIKVKGKYFSKNPAVYFGDIKASLLRKSDTLFEAIVPYPNSNQLPVTPYKSIKIINEDKQERVSSLFTLHTPKIDSIIPRQITDSDTLKIYGAHFETDNVSNLISVKYKNTIYSLNILEAREDKIVLAPLSLRENNFPLTLKSQLTEIETEINVLQPNITGISKKCLGFEEEFTIYGSNFPVKSDTWFAYRLGIAFPSVLISSKDSVKLKLTNFSEYDGFNDNKLSISFLGEDIVFEAESICITEPWVRLKRDSRIHSISKQQVKEKIEEDINMLAFSRLSNQEGYRAVKYNTKDKEFDFIKESEVRSSYSGTSAVLNNNSIYSYKYFNPGAYFSSYNIFTGEEKNLKNFPGKDRASNGLMVSVSDYIYYGLGNEYPSGALTDIWKYSIVDDSWEKIIDNFPSINSNDNAILSPLVFKIDNNVYFGSGQIDENILDFWMLDTQTNSLLQKANLPEPNLKHIRPTVIGSKAYFQYKNMYEYDSIKDTWRTIQTNGEEYFSGSFFNDGNDIYMYYIYDLYLFNKDYLE